MSDYRVHAGDTLSSIADRFEVSLEALEKANPQIADPNLIFVNELVHIPDGVPVDQPTHVPPHVVTYVVQAGNTKSGIAEAHNISLEALEAANPQITNPDVIHIGQVINIPGSNGHATGHQPGPTATGTISIGQVTYGWYHGGGTIDSWITDACRALGVPAQGWLPGYRTLCQRESSDLPNNYNDHDSNAWGPVQSDHLPLHCSRGVAQCIPDTFAHYHASGTSTDIYDPVANIAASMRYVMDRYDVAADGSNLTARVQQADAHRDPMGY